MGSTKKYNLLTTSIVFRVFILASCDSAVLKNLMLYLKTKSLTSENLYKQSTKEVDDMFMDLLSVFQRYYDHAPEADKQTLRSMLDLIILVSQQVHSSHRQAESALSDFKIYITALEGSYKNVDGDFEKNIAQPAEREADEKAKEEEERAKAIEEYSKRVRPKFYE
jgi:tRNA A37 N6-isopentenylltransferase MiaA